MFRLLRHFDRMNRREMIAATGAALLLPTNSSATPPTDADLKGDIAILREALALHPGLYRYASPRRITARIDALEPAFIAAPTLAARYLLLSHFLATIRCGHSYCNFFNQSKPVAKALFDRPTRLPYRFAWMHGEMVVLADDSGLGRLPRGTVVESVNGLPAPRLLASLLPYARADGHNDAKRTALLEVRGGERIEYFDVFHGLVHGAPGGEHVLRVRLPDGAQRTMDFPAWTLEQRRAATRLPDYNGDQPVWDWTMRPDRIAVLTMPGWALFDSKWDWRTWLDARLASLSGAKGLVIDLRANEGGQDCGDAILARLIDRPLHEAGSERRVRFRRTPALLDAHLDTWDDSFRTLGVDAADLGNGFYRLQGEQADDAIQPVGPRLTLPVATLIGPTNSSATFQFADKARRAGGGRLFGSPTGGNRRGINGGCFFFVRLPASGIEFDLPLIGYFPPGLPPDAGITPDVQVAPTSADIAAGRDPVLDAAIAWAKRT